MCGLYWSIYHAIEKVRSDMSVVHYFATLNSNLPKGKQFLKQNAQLQNQCSLFWGCGGFGTSWDLWRYLSIVAAVWQIENPIFECVTSHVLGLGGELHRSLRNCPPLINTAGSVVSDNVEDPGDVGGKNPGKMLLSWDIGGLVEGVLGGLGMSTDKAELSRKG